MCGEYSPTGQSANMPEYTTDIDCIIPDTCAGQRLDQALASVLSDYSRVSVQNWIKSGALTVDGQAARPRDKVFGGEAVRGTLTMPAVEEALPQDLPLTIIYEDDDLIVLNKAAGVVVHPAAGNRDGTLVNALLHHRPDLERLPRAGLVHRLDKETSGLLVVAASHRAHTSLVAQLQTRSMGRRYIAVTQGVPVAGGTVDLPIGRHAGDRKRMSVTPTGKPAVTHYTVNTKFRGFALVDVRLETGRTHQIRVHLAHVRYPLIGDPAYGARLKLPPRMVEADAKVVRSFHRQALHAQELQLNHPADDRVCRWRAPVPDDLSGLIDALTADARRFGVLDD